MVHQMVHLPLQNKISTKLKTHMSTTTNDPEDHMDDALKNALDQANAFKERGNEAFKKGENSAAIELYTSAIELDPDNHIYYSNRSAAYLATGDAKSKALKDAEMCLTLKPQWVKGYIRKGAAEHALTRFEAAKQTYYKGLDIDPDNSTLLAAIDAVHSAANAHSAFLREQYQRNEVLRVEREAAQAKAKAEAEIKVDEEDVNEEDALLADFMAEVEQLEDQTNCIQPTNESSTTETTIPKPEVDFGTASEQVERLTQPHYDWINLNPYLVLCLDPTSTSEEDIKRHYRKLSTLVHPDKCQLENARAAFEEVKKAHVMLLDSDKRKNYAKIIENAEKKAVKERKNLLKKGMKQNQLEDEEHVKSKAVMKAFADMENRRRNLEQREAKQRKRESDQQEKEQVKMRDNYKQEREWGKVEHREKRMGSWINFQKDGKKSKTSAVAGWKEEASSTAATSNSSSGNNQEYRKNWK